MVNETFVIWKLKDFFVIVVADKIRCRTDNACIKANLKDAKDVATRCIVLRIMI
jgi:hypothetical protein